MSNRKLRFQLAALALATVATAPGLAQAESPSLYSLPWQLRSVTVGSAARLDSTMAAFNDPSGNVEVTHVTGISAHYLFDPNLEFMLRLSHASTDAPGGALDGGSFANPLLGASYARSTGRLKWSLYGATTLPIGSGGGNEPDPVAARANQAATTALPTDTALYAINYLTPMLGGDLAYVHRGFTAQAEATLQHLIRMGGATSSTSLDQFRTHAALGLHLGYFIGAHFSLGTDLHYARWLSPITTRDPASGATVPLPDQDVDSLTLAAGARVHFRVGTSVSLHPGVALLRGFGGRSYATPLATTETTAVQLDIPVSF